MATFTGTSTGEYIGPSYVSPSVKARPVGSRPGDTADTISGGGGADTIDGGAGADTLHGDGGNDLVLVGAGDRVFGDDGDDTLQLRGSDFPLLLNGGSGFDIIQDNNGTDITGATIAGVEQLNAYFTLLTAAQLDLFQTVSGFDASYSSARITLTQGGKADVALTASLTDYFELRGSGQADAITFAAAETTTIYAYGGAGNDTLISGAGADFLRGDDGDDILNGRGGFDTIGGGAGDDTIIGGGGNDALDGSTGTDIASFADSSTTVTVSLALQGSAQNTGSAGWDTLDNIEGLIGGTANDVLVGDANANILRGGAGDDNLNGGDAADVLEGGLGRDILEGGGGRDQASYESAAGPVSLDLGVTGFQATGGTGEDRLVSIEDARGSVNDDVLTGSAADNRLYGGAGADRIDGGDGDDTLRGEAGNDLLDGGLGADVVEGGDGADRLRGGAGDDVLRGDGGGDFVLVRTDAGGETILDFTDGIDHLDVAGFGASFDSAAEILAAADQIGTGVRIVLPNPGSGNTAVVLESFALANLSAADFSSIIA